MSVGDFIAGIRLSLYFNIFSALGGFGLVLSHRKAAVFTARRFELLELVHTTLSYLHPDSRVHSFLSPLPYQVNCFPLIDDCIDEHTYCTKSYLGYDSYGSFLFHL